MATPVRSILKSLTPSETLDIVSFVNYPYYDWMFSLVPHKFHLYRGDRIPCGWNEQVLQKPKNFDQLIDPDIPLNIDANLVLCHDRLNQLDLARAFSSFWHLPICTVHQLGPRDMKFDRRWRELQSRRGNTNIFLSQKIQEEWECAGYIIPPGIPEINYDESKQKEVSHIECSDNERNMLAKTLQQQISFVKNGDFSSTLILINTTTQYYPVHALIGMASGCCVLFQQMPELEGVIEHEKNALIYKDVNDARVMLNHYKSRPDRCKEIGKAAKETVRKMFPIKVFKDKLNIALKQTSEMTYTL
jgi:hypothetical protein